jgi:serine/threonine-protein kinase HipA
MGANKNTRSAQKTQLDVCIGKEGLPVGELAYVKDGAREYSVFAYSQDWLRQRRTSNGAKESSNNNLCNV